MDKARHERSPPAPGIQDEGALLSETAPFQQTFRGMEELLDTWLGSFKA